MVCMVNMLKKQTVLVLIWVVYFLLQVWLLKLIVVLARMHVGL